MSKDARRVELKCGGAATSLNKEPGESDVRKGSPTLFRIRRTAVRIAASGALPEPSVIRVIVVGHS